LPFASANQNVKKHSLILLEKTRQILSEAGAKLGSIMADTQYSDEKIRMTAGAVMPYPANQKCSVKAYLGRQEVYNPRPRKTEKGVP
jgi:hypothetical protein